MQLEMEYIYQVYLERNFSKAAEKLFISQPALSMAIKKVEEQVGMPLFDRSGRPLLLTPAGEAYVAHIKQIQAMEAELALELQDIKEAGSGHICIGGSHYLNAYILPEVLQGFMTKYPGITVEIKEASSAVLAEMLSEQKIDLTFNCNPRFMMDFERYPVFTDRILLAVPKKNVISQELRDKALSSYDIAGGKHFEEACPSVSLADFENQEYIILTSGNNLRDRSFELFKEAGFEPKVRMELSQLVTAYHLADAGIGAAFVSDRLIVRGEDNLYYYRIDSSLTTRQFYVLLPNRKYTSIAVRAFIDYVNECI